MPIPVPVTGYDFFTGPFDGAFAIAFVNFGAFIPDMIYYTGETVPFWMQCTDPATGAATDATGTPTFAVYRNGSDTAVESGSLAKQDDAGTTGWYKGSVTLDGDYSANTVYTVRGSATVAGVAQGGPLCQFVVRAVPATSAQSVTIIADIAALPATISADGLDAPWVQVYAAPTTLREALSLSAMALVNENVRNGATQTIKDNLSVDAVSAPVQESETQSMRGQFT